jgi:hypothetical protein
MAVYTVSHRKSLMAWLCRNDRNGVYRDADCIREFGRPATDLELYLCRKAQILEG